MESYGVDCCSCLGSQCFVLRHVAPFFVDVAFGVARKHFFLDLGALWAKVFGVLRLQKRFSPCF